MEAVSGRRYIRTMAKRERQQRYLGEGAGAGLVRVETLVPADGRDEILRLASRLRGQARDRVSEAKKGIDVEEVLAWSVHYACRFHVA